MGEQPVAQKSKLLSLIPLLSGEVPHSFPEVILFATPWDSGQSLGLSEC